MQILTMSMDEQTLIELAVIKSSVTPQIISSIKKIVATWNANGCFVIYRETKFLITVKHSFAGSLSNGSTIHISVCRDQWHKFEGVLYMHSEADVSVIQINKEGFSPRNYINLSDEKMELKPSDKFVILGYQNRNEDCSEKPMLQKSTFKFSIDPYQDMYTGVAIPGYSGSPIFHISEAEGFKVQLAGLLTKSKNQLFYLGENKTVREEGDEIIIENLNVISASRLAILETLNLAFPQ